MPSDVFTVHEQIGSPEYKGHHVVILGAGASLAAFPDGDRNGRKLPVMRNFVEVVGLASLLSANGINPPYDDFEGIYSDIAGHWRTLASALKSAWTITFFGYGIPKTDVEAIDLLKNAWGNPVNF